ncbi:Dabb family protein [uncultured Devosia sp.]|uniref:Dabb family protein n=1 Tax=uncultured Devosia sp. TaxID=211434 RepID=UPI0026085182|nr:Dabb family protein [uncultured Devosia sp.]
MIRHIVLLRFRPEVTAAEKASLYAELESLRELVPGFLDMSHGANASPEGLHQGYTEGFTMDFADAAARDAYLVHPAHKAAGGRLVAALDGGRDGLIVFDIVV